MNSFQEIALSAFKSRINTFSFILAITSFQMTDVLAANVNDLPQWQHHQFVGKPSLRGSAIVGNSMWVTGSNNGVFVSQNGGKTWTDKSVNAAIKTDFRDIELFDKQTAIVMGVGSGKTSALYKTKDGGNSWHLLYQNMDEKGFFDSIAFWDEKTGLLLGDPVDGYYVVKKTQDGGKTWRRIKQNKLPPFLDKEAAFAASGNTLIVGKKGKAYLTTGGFSASVYVSDDYGESWQRQSVPLYQATQTAGGYGLALNHQGQPFVLGGDYQQRPKKYSNIATLIEGEWQQVQAGENGLRTAMSCQTNLCIATGKTSSDISFNHGKTWQELSNAHGEINDRGFYTIASDADVFLAAGTDGKVGVLSLKKGQ
ncbi:WD40/YVTN/BNR-like repeat-containing protein [Colwelliaceae bacterium 6441]